MPIKSLGGDAIYTVEFITLGLMRGFGLQIHIWEPSMCSWYLKLRLDELAKDVTDDREGKRLKDWPVGMPVFGG